MIYCVIPEALADELFEKMSAYYADDPNVEVIIDRRKAERRRAGTVTEERAHQRVVRDRRRARVPGDLPETPAA
ncbi:hypothetical protein [Conexibacter sp. DBS9H8]|uniref:hypothetical protein n=1 Tax=Conexibacter sp. DBS9H8 TaxID=2937801 RepID=UPI00200E8D45|nr:hypothetical protein [Conexibacter sp. DBS9H8]